MLITIVYIVYYNTIFFQYHCANDDNMWKNSIRIGQYFETSTNI